LLRRLRGCSVPQWTCTLPHRKTSATSRICVRQTGGVRMQVLCLTMTMTMTMARGVQARWRPTTARE